MSILDPAVLRILYRFVHLLGMAALLGGALLLTASLARGDLADESNALRLARRYEWLFWIVLALQVFTGLGNVGMQAAAFEGFDTARDRYLLYKLLLLLALLLGSLTRTELVHRATALVEGARQRAVGPRVLARAYGLTAGALGAITFFALRLAHG